MTVYYCELKSPVGKLLVAGNAEGVRYISFPGSKKSEEMPRADWVRDAGPLTDALAQLEQYFAGERRTFSVNVTLTGTPFQKEVWQALREIPYGETRSYGDIARAVGNPKASRAVGAANARNPVPVIIPCHRVIGASGKLVGFGGGLDVKETLLSLEQRYRSANSAA